MKQALTITYLLTIMISCSTPEMVVSNDLQNAGDRFDVKGKNGSRIKQKLSFGNYSSSNLKRSWTRTSLSAAGIGFGTRGQQDWVNIIGTEYMQKKQTLQFALQDSGLSSQVFCVSKFDAENLQLGKNSNSILNIGLDLFDFSGYASNMYYVQIFPSGKDQRPWEIVLDNDASQARPRKYTGYLARSKNEFYSIVPVTKIAIKQKEGNMFAGSIGYEFRNAKGEAVAAVTGMNKGMVYLAKISREEKFLLANACAAILLQDVLE